MRVEQDFLGVKQLPADAYYGIQTARASENFPITGNKIAPELIRAFAIVKKAAALANRERNQLDIKIASAIVQAAEELKNGQWHEQIIVDPVQGGAGTSINMNINEVLANRAIELMGGQKGSYSLVSPNSHVNMSQSTNDSFPTAIRIAVITLLEELIYIMKKMTDTFQAKAKEFDSILKMGRTHLQDAVPIRLGQEFEAYRRVLMRDIERISQTKKHLYEINIGATAVGTGLNADPIYAERALQYLASLTGYPLKSADHLVDATQNTDMYTEVSSALKICMINMSKISNDLRLMSSGPFTGLGEIRLPHRQPGSSIMPGKVNPVMCEVLNQVAFQVIGNDHTVSLASEAGQFELNVMEPVLIFNLIQSITMMKNTFEVFRSHCLEGIEANEEVCSQYVERSLGTAAALNPYIGYEMSSIIAYEAQSKGISMRDLCLQKKVLKKEQLESILDPYRMTEPGIAGEKLTI
ncbi:aspartate ammonia-lyase [Domibacillus enclensis]|nr:aspartate ammonia-lyase [Domibacillus enclensis]OXS74247.1 aspartate ammonia-lyase [Domibacillus enclensis]